MKLAQDLVVVMGHPGLVTKLAIERVEQTPDPADEPDPRPQLGPAQRCGHLADISRNI
jgi:hypothetical protein